MNWRLFNEDQIEYHTKFISSDLWKKISKLVVDYAEDSSKLWDNWDSIQNIFWNESKKGYILIIALKSGLDIDIKKGKWFFLGWLVPFFTAVWNNIVDEIFKKLSDEELLRMEKYIVNIPEDIK